MSGLTQKQTWAFFKTVAVAANALGVDREQYRHQVMMEETGKESLKQLDRKADFEACMVRFWSDAGDFEMAARYMGGDARRLGRMCEVCAMQIAQITGVSTPKGGVPYVMGVIQQAGYAPQISGSTWCLDLPESDTRRVFAMLDTHRRRLLRSAGVRFPFTFHLDASYHRADDGTVTIQPKTHPPDCLTIRPT